MQAEKLRRLENKNDDIDSHAFSTYLYVVIITARVEVRNSCVLKGASCHRTLCVRLSVICAAIPDIKLRAETKVRYTIKNWCNFNRFNTILNDEIFLNLIRKMK